MGQYFKRSNDKYLSDYHKGGRDMLDVLDILEIELDVGLNRGPGRE